MTNGSHSDHADHDQLAVASFAAGDAVDLELERARQLVAGCASCAALFADLQALQAATASLPAPRRIRDFRLTEADAARLRPRGWRSILAAFGSPRLAFTQPLAVGMATLGIVGLLVASLPGPLMTATAPASDGGATVEMAPEGAPAGSDDLLKTEATGPLASAAPGDATMPAAPAETPSTALVPAPSPAEGTAAERTDAQADLGFDSGTRELGDTSGTPWLTALSALLLVVGVALFAAGRLARRAR